jgi:hypothetical protein
MRIRILEFDVTPEELARTPELRDLLQAHGPIPTPAGEREKTGPEAAPALPASLAKVLEARGPGGAVLEALHEFLATVVGWPGVESRVGVSRRDKERPANVIRLHRRGSGVGAFVYVELPTGSLKFRLPRSHSLKGLAHARAREVKAGAPYGIALRLAPATLVDALTLARRAYDHTEAATAAAG